MQFLQNINGYFLNQLISICKEIIINVKVVTHCELFFNFFVSVDLHSFFSSNLFCDDPNFKEFYEKCRNFQ